MSLKIPTVGVGVVVQLGNYVLLTKRGHHVQRAPGMYSLPGGSVDPYDISPLAAAKRELREECGLTTTWGWSQLNFTSFGRVPGDEQNFLTQFFTCYANPNQVARNMEPEKCDDVAWFPLHALPEVKSFFGGAHDAISEAFG